MKRLLVLIGIGYSLFSCEFLFCPPSLFASDGAFATHSSMQNFHGVDVTKAPRTTDTRNLPDLWEERPKGSLSFEIRKDVQCVYSGLDGTVYYISKQKCFYIQSDPLGSSTMTCFGPFQGDPAKVLKGELKRISE